MTISGPAAIRIIANEAAKHGFAGRLAAKAARKRESDDDTMMMLSYLTLFVHVIRQAGFHNANWKTLDVNDPQTRAKSRKYLKAYSAKLGLDADKLLSEMEAISRSVAFVGIGTGGVPSPASVQLEKMRQFSASVTAWNQMSAAPLPLSRLIVEAADLTIAKVDKTIRQSRRVTDDVPRFLKTWFTKRLQLQELFALPDWMLDGWPHICALWQSVEEHERHTQIEALNVIADLVPLMPTEIDKWLGADRRAPCWPDAARQACAAERRLAHWHG